MQTRTHHVAVLAGDGIGPEVMAEALKVMDAAAKKFGFTVTRDERLVGGAAIDACGRPLPDETVEACDRADAILCSAPWAARSGTRSRTSPAPKWARCSP